MFDCFADEFFEVVGDGDVVVYGFWGALGGMAGFRAVAGFVVEATGAAVASFRRGAGFGGFVFPD